MEFTAEQLQMFREPFEEAGAFVGYSEEEIKKLVEGIAEIYITLAELSLKNKKIINNK